MNTTEAALEAHVTTATIRTWARRGVVAATKTAGRWFINAASLARRIAIAALKTRKASMTATQITLTDTTTGYFGVSGPADILRAAYENGTPVTLTGEYEGEVVYLGRAFRSSADVVLKTVGLDHEDNGTAVYLINDDLDRMTGAPKTLAAIDAAINAAYAAQASADAADDAYLNGYYE